jgi:hypothetical protein
VQAASTADCHLLLASTLSMDTVISFEASVDFYQTTRRYIPGDSTTELQLSLNVAFMYALVARLFKNKKPVKAGQIYGT